jgi:hypothetical protein
MSFIGTFCGTTAVGTAADSRTLKEGTDTKERLERQVLFAKVSARRLSAETKISPHSQRLRDMAEV